MRKVYLNANKIDVPSKFILLDIFFPIFIVHNYLISFRNSIIDRTKFLLLLVWSTNIYYTDFVYYYFSYVWLVLVL
jgi:hypothetical protein